MTKKTKKSNQKKANQKKELNKQPRFYDYEPIIGRNPWLALIIGGRNIGKTFGARIKAIEDYINHGYKFAELTRRKVQLEGSDSIQSTYFDKIVSANIFPGYAFKTEGVHGYIASKEFADEDGKIPHNKWELLCYFIPIANYHETKTNTFDNVRTVIFDEFLIDKGSNSRYLKNEVYALFQTLGTLNRRNPDGSYNRMRVFCLANAVDFVAPILQTFGINKVPKHGFHWLDSKKSVLLHYVEPGYIPIEELSPIDSFIMDNFDESGMMFNNEFSGLKEDYIEKKPSSASFAFGIVFNGDKFGVWEDQKEGEYFYYISSKIPNNLNPLFNPIYSLTKEDYTINYTAVDKTAGIMKGLVQFYYRGCVRYENHALRSSFFEVLSFLGVR